MVAAVTRLEVAATEVLVTVDAGHSSFCTTLLLDLISAIVSFDVVSFLGLAILRPALRTLQMSTHQHAIA